MENRSNQILVGSVVLALLALVVVFLVWLARLGDAEDLKGAALLFCSAAGKHITGQILAVDGGVTAT